MLQIGEYYQWPGFSEIPFVVLKELGADYFEIRFVNKSTSTKWVCGLSKFTHLPNYEKHVIVTKEVTELIK